jgi:protein-S-isoprenylcysteine O-methyltransferase Ste14
MRNLDLPPIWLLVFAVVAWILARLEPSSLGLGGGWSVVAGLVLLAAGVAAITLAVTTMRRHRTAVRPRAQASHLVTGGAFALSRNPIYLGAAAILAGIALLLDSPLALLLVPAYVLLIDRRFVLSEEAGLQAAFGPEFQAYRARTRRWL